MRTTRYPFCFLPLVYHRSFPPKDESKSGQFADYSQQNLLYSLVFAKRLDSFCTTAPFAFLFGGRACCRSTARWAIGLPKIKLGLESRMVSGQQEDLIEQNKSRFSPLIALLLCLRCLSFGRGSLFPFQPPHPRAEHDERRTLAVFGRLRPHRLNHRV